MLFTAVYQRQLDAWRRHPESTRHNILKLIRSQISEFQREEGLQREEEPTEGYEDGDADTLNHFLMQELTESERRQQQQQISDSDHSVAVNCNE